MSEKLHDATMHIFFLCALVAELSDLTWLWVPALGSFAIGMGIAAHERVRGNELWGSVRTNG